MADNMTQAEILETIREYNDALKQGTPISQDLANKMRDATTKIKGSGEAFDKTLIKLASTTTDLTKTLYNGKQGAAAFNNQIDAVADALGTLAAVLVPGGALVKIAVFGISKALGSLAKTTAEQSDQLYKSFQDLSRAGTIGAGGMTEVSQRMQQFGYGLGELDNMTALLKANSTSLAKFGKTAFSGAAAIGEVAEGIKNSDLRRQFMNMGMTVDDINSGLMGYSRQEYMLGQMRNKSTQELIAGSADYLKNMEGLSRLTGQNKQELEAQREELLRNNMVYAKVREMNAEIAGSGDEMLRTIQRGYAMSPDMGKAMAAQITGFIGNDPSVRKMLFAASGEVGAAMQDFGQHAITGDQALQRIGNALQQNMPNLLSLGKIPGSEDLVGNLVDINTVVEKTNQNFALSSREVADNLNVVDKNTDSQSRLRIQQMNARDSLQSFVNNGVGPATDALRGLAGAANAAAGGKNMPKTTGPVPAGGPQTLQQFQKDLGLKTFGSKGTIGGQMGAILDTIGQAESRGNYNVLVGGKQADLTNMTIQQVMDMQKQMIAQGHESTAVGKYQVINKTLQATVQQLGLDLNTKFDKRTQDLIGAQLVKNRGYESYASGKMSQEQFLQNLSMEWAGLPRDSGGTSYYAGVGSNRATVGYQDMVNALTVPTSGYKTALNPELPGSKGSSGEEQTQKTLNQMNLLDAFSNSGMLDRLDVMIRQQQKTNDLNSKILQQAKS